jgi:hypothetical protein
MPSEVTERFLHCYQLLRKDGIIKSGRQFAMDLDYLPQSWNEIVQGRRDVPLDLLQRAIDTYKLDPSFLFSGDGEPFYIEKMNERVRIRTVVVNEKAQERLVFVPITALAAYPKEVQNPDFFKILPIFTLPDFHYQASTHRCFEILGDQMEPGLYEGDRVVCSFLHPDKWVSGIKDNHCYIVVTKAEVSARRLINKLELSDSLILMPDNNYFSPVKLHISDILEIWLIIQKISPYLHSKLYQDDIVKEQIALLNDQMIEQNKLLRGLLDREA